MTGPTAAGKDKAAAPDHGRSAHAHGRGGNAPLPFASLLGLHRSIGNAAFSAAARADPDHLPASVHSVLHSQGQPLEPTVRSFMEERFGHNFGHVRVHTDLTAAQSAADVSAKAYTVGNHVVFRPGEYAPDTTEGRRSIAHELAHVVQQSRGGGRAPGLNVDSHLEHDAHAAAERISVSSGSADTPVQGSGASAPGLARQEDTRKRKSQEIDLGQYFTPQRVAVPETSPPAQPAGPAELHPETLPQPNEELAAAGVADPLKSVDLVKLADKIHRIEQLLAGKPYHNEETAELARRLNVLRNARMRTGSPALKSETIEQRAGEAAEHLQTTEQIDPHFQVRRAANEEHELRRDRAETEGRLAHQQRQILPPGRDYQSDPRYIDNFVRSSYDGNSRTMHFFYADGTEYVISIDSLRERFAKPKPESPRPATVEGYAQGSQVPDMQVPERLKGSDKIYPLAVNRQTAPNMANMLDANKDVIEGAELFAKAGNEIINPSVGPDLGMWPMVLLLAAKTAAPKLTQIRNGRGRGGPSGKNVPPKKPPSPSGGSPKSLPHGGAGTAQVDEHTGTPAPRSAVARSSDVGGSEVSGGAGKVIPFTKRPPSAPPLEPPDLQARPSVKSQVGPENAVHPRSAPSVVRAGAANDTTKPIQAQDLPLVQEQVEQFQGQAANSNALRAAAGAEGGRVYGGTRGTWTTNAVGAGGSSGPPPTVTFRQRVTSPQRVQGSTADNTREATEAARSQASRRAAIAKRPTGQQLRPGEAPPTAPNYGKEPEVPISGPFPEPKKIPEGGDRAAIYRAAAEFEEFVHEPFQRAYPGGTRQQLTILEGTETKYATQGASRLDTVVDPLKLSIDAKKYGGLVDQAKRSKLIYDVVEQAKDRAVRGNLPKGYAQAVVIDGRGQKLTDAHLTELIDRIAAESNGAVAKDRIWIVLDK